MEQPYQGEGMITFTAEVPENARALRVDPALCPCVVLVHDMRLDGRATPWTARLMRTNGTPAAGGSVVFATGDPAMTWDMAKLRRKTGIRGACRVTMTLQMSGLPATMAAAMRK